MVHQRRRARVSRVPRRSPAHQHSVPPAIHSAGSAREPSDLRLSLIGFALRGVLSISSLLSVVMLARALGPSGRGEFFLFVASVGVLTRLGDLGVASSAVVFVGRFPVCHMADLSGSLAVHDARLARCFFTRCRHHRAGWRSGRGAVAADVRLADRRGPAADAVRTTLDPHDGGSPSHSDHEPRSSGRRCADSWPERHRRDEPGRWCPGSGGCVRRGHGRPRSRHGCAGATRRSAGRRRARPISNTTCSGLACVATLAHSRRSCGRAYQRSRSQPDRMAPGRSEFSPWVSRCKSSCRFLSRRPKMQFTSA